MDNLQEAYTSYQQALYHLRDPKVCRDMLAFGLTKANFSFSLPGTQIVVRYWYLV